MDKLPDWTGETIWRNEEDNRRMFRLVGVDLCGFLALDDARKARDRLHEAGMRTQIIINDIGRLGLDDPVHEEFWIRCRHDHVERAVEVLGAEPEFLGVVDYEAPLCSECYRVVPEGERFCPQCGVPLDG